MSRGKVVVLGQMTCMPVAGVVWQNVHYIEGFERIGFDAYYVEAHARVPRPLMRDKRTDGSAAAARFIADVMGRFGLGRDRWAFHALHSNEAVYGLSGSQLQRLYDEACLIINLHGGTVPRDEHARTGRLVYLETDPVRMQFKLASGDEDAFRFLEPHVAFFSFAENLGRPDCRLPVIDRYRFSATRQPVVLDHWRARPGRRRATFTTVGNWRQNGRLVSDGTSTYRWSKHLEYLKIVDLPRRTRQTLELALSSIRKDEEAMLERHGWTVVDAQSRSMDPDVYRDYITSSSGEFTVAKDQNVRLRTGWFSDRSATYLAAGRPVVTQDTGFGAHLPTGAGLFSFFDIEGAAAALEAIASDPARHEAAASAIAEQYFAAEVVLEELASKMGV